tara:strand:- start:548 stop:868 length:321 start_codon:yes stop_codon:yes gene_type:complete
MNKKEIKEIKKELKKAFPKGSTAYTKLIHCSQSGMTRIIQVINIKKNEPFYNAYKISQLLDYKHAEKNGDMGVKVGGCGMDMGFHLIYNLSSVLYKDGYAIKQRWI